MSNIKVGSRCKCGHNQFYLIVKGWSKDPPEIKCTECGRQYDSEGNEIKSNRMDGEQ